MCFVGAISLGFRYQTEPTVVFCYFYVLSWVFYIAFNVQLKSRLGDDVYNKSNIRYYNLTGELMTRCIALDTGS